MTIKTIAERRKQRADLAGQTSNLTSKARWAFGPGNSTIALDNRPHLWQHGPRTLVGRRPNRQKGGSHEAH